MTLEHGLVEGHDVALLFAGQGRVEEVVTRHLVHEWEEVTDKIRRPVVEEDVLVLFGLEEGDAVNAEGAQGALVEGKKQAMEMPAQAVVETREELGEFLLGHRRREEDVPNGQAGEGLRVAREQAVEKGGAGAKVAQQKERTFDGLGLVAGEEDVIEPEEEPVNKRTDRPYEVEKGNENQPFAREARGRVFRLEEGAVEHLPE